MTDPAQPTQNLAKGIGEYFRNVRLREKLLGFALLAGIPTLVLGTMFIRDRTESVSFLNKSRNGILYAAEVWPALVDVSRRSGSGSKSNEASDTIVSDTKVIERLQNAIAHFDPLMGTGESGANVMGSLKSSPDAAAKTLVEHLQKIADNSNLILDYELDALYMVTAGLVEMPRAILAAREVGISANELNAASVINEEHRNALLIAGREVEHSSKIVLEQVLRAVEASGNESTKASILPKALEFQHRAKLLEDSADNMISGKIPASEAAKQVQSNVLALMTASDGLWQITMKELDSTLSTRASALTNGLLMGLGLAAMLLGLAAIVLFRIASSIQRPISQLLAKFEQLRQGSTDFEVPYLLLKNEVGDIARAIESSRINAAELSRARAEIDSRLFEETNRSADTTNFLADISKVVRAAGEGQFYERLPEGGRNGFLFELSRNLNHLLSIVESGIGGTSAMVKALASGEVASRMQGDFNGIFAELKGNMNKLGEQLTGISGRIGYASSAVQVATREISSGVADLSGRTEQQASSLEETAASMEELAATVRQNAENAQEANQLAAAARQLSVSGGAIATRAVDAMDKIEASSRQVSEIIGLIQEIAFQTNILALNAAVEAARAGDAGRGFAVVANEVRALAQRSAQASKDIKELITSTETNVSEGVGMVKQAGNSLTEITHSVRKVADIVSEIAAASQEQSAGIDQVSRAITNMDELTQQNAALVEETNAALQSARNQADELLEAVSFFKVAKSERQGAADAPQSAAAPKAAPQTQAPGGLSDRLRKLAQQMALTTKRPAEPTTSRQVTAANTTWKEF